MSPSEKTVTIDRPLQVGVLQHFDFVSPWSWFKSGYSKLSVTQIRPRSSNVMATGFTKTGPKPTSSTLNPEGTVIF